MIEQEEIVIRLKHVEDLLCSFVKSQMFSIVEKELNDPKIKKLYNLTGEYTTRELENKVGLSRSTISNTWKHWESLGLLIKDGKTYRKVL